MHLFPKKKPPFDDLMFGNLITWLGFSVVLGCITLLYLAKDWP